MPRTTIQFQGQEVEIEYHDFGYESDTNAHDIEWEFVDKIWNEFTPLSDEDEEAVMLHLYQLSHEREGWIDYD